MNSPLEHDFVGYEYSPERKSQDDGTPESETELDENASTDSSSINLAPDLLHCEICGQEFLKKKDLRFHINVHLGQPRVLLRRIPNLKSVKKKHDEKYWLDPDQKGTLKLTLKKQCSSDSLKLTLKKSSVSEDFTVINSNLDCQSDDYSEQEVAGLRGNDNKDDAETDKSVNEPFENVILNQQEDYDNSKYDTDTRNPLEDTERTLVDINEGDSGVGSDMANPSEREDQNIDDLQAGDNYENSERTVTENEFPEESDALEATCRETIENLKILGEQSSSRSTTEISRKSSTEEEESSECSNNVMQSLQSKPEISLVPKSSMMPLEPARSSERAETEKEREQSGTNSTFSWNQITTDENDKRNESNEGTSETGGTTGDSHNENTGTLLQNFLLEHQRRNQNEASLSNNIPTFETEYVSIERLAETVNTCRVCNEKFKDINQLDAHKAKSGHFQCNIPDCGNLIFNNPMEVSIHKMQIHGTPMSPNMNQMSPHMSASSPHLNQNSPYMNHNSPHLNRTSPHMNPNSPHLNANSPHMDPHAGHNPQVTGSSPHQTNSPTYNAVPNSVQQMISPVNFDQLPAPVQQLAQQVQRMPLPQSQMQPSLPPGANTMIPAPNIYIQPPGRPPMYRVSAPQGMYPPHMPHMYSQYPPPPGYPGPQMGVPPQMHPQMPQQMPRSRYSTIVQTPRAPRIPPPQAMPRQRLKRPMQQQVPMQQPNNTAVNKQRRMDVLLPDRNEDPDCHVIAQQKRNDGVPVIQNVQGAATQPNRNDSTIHLTDSITLSVRQPGSAPAQVQSTAGPSGKKPDAKAVANVLAARGITVTPAMQKGKSGEPNKQLPQQQQQQQQQQPQRPAPAQNITALNLNSAISIIPASSQRKQQEQQQQQQQQQGQFAVPQNKQSKQTSNDVERPPRPPTVDLTQDTPAPPLVRRGRPPRALLTCQVCDKRFQNQEMLTQHMANHRATSKLLHKCNLCPAQYPTASALLTHKQTYHKEVDTNLQNGGIELALPVVDLKSPHVLNRLSNLGIQSFIPLSQLSAQTGGYFGLPIVTIDGARNPNVCNLGALGATSILSLGPLKHMSNR